MQRRRNVPAQSVPAAALAAPIRPSIVGVWAHPTPLIVTSPTSKPMPIGSDFISFPLVVISDITFRQKSRNLFTGNGVLPDTSVGEFQNEANNWKSRRRDYAVRAGVRPKRGQTAQVRTCGYSCQSTQHVGFSDRRSAAGRSI